MSPHRRTDDIPSTEGREMGDARREVARPRPANSRFTVEAEDMIITRLEDQIDPTDERPQGSTRG